MHAQLHELKVASSQREHVLEQVFKSLCLVDPVQAYAYETACIFACLCAKGSSADTSTRFCYRFANCRSWQQRPSD